MTGIDRLPHDGPGAPDAPSPGADSGGGSDGAGWRRPQGPHLRFADGAGDWRDFELSDDDVRRGVTVADGWGHAREAAPEHTPEARHDEPAAKRPEWAALLQTGQVEQVGLGVVDQRDRRFPPDEERIARYLAATDGCAVSALDDHDGRHGPTPDATIDATRHTAGTLTEFKSLDVGASHATVRAALNDATRQARHAVVDARGSGLTEHDADRGADRYWGQPWRQLDDFRIIGDTYDLHYSRRRT